MASNYDWCKTCGKFAHLGEPRWPGDVHICPPRWMVWRPEEGEDPLNLEDYSVVDVYADSAEEAAEKFASDECSYDPDYVDGYLSEGRTVYVLKAFNYTEGEFDPADVEKFHVSAEHSLEWYVNKAKDYK